MGKIGIMGFFSDVAIIISDGTTTGYVDGYNEIKEIWNNPVWI